MENEKLKLKMIKGFIWRLFENLGTQLVNFIIQIVLARILLPKDYGLIAIITVFISIFSVFIQTGFSSALIQKKEVTDEDYSSVFYAGIVLSVILYGILFSSAPIIANYYNEQLLKPILRLQSLVLIFNSVSSVHSSILVRNLDFKKSFLTSILSTIIHGVTGISLALNGFGVWALVFSNLIHYFSNTIILWKVVDWKPMLFFSIKSLKSMFSFSSKILLINLVNSLFVNLKSLFIGKIYDTTTLAYYNRGFQIPTLIMTNTDGALNTVLFPALSKYQDNMPKLVNGLRRSFKSSFFLTLPMMVGLSIVAEPLTIILMTEKWLPSVPYLRAVCLICITWPFSAKNYAYNAIGRTDITLKLNIVEKITEIILIFVTYQYGALVMVYSGFVSGLVPAFIGLFTNRQILGYKIKDQFKDIVPTIIYTIIMAVPTYFIGFRIDNTNLKLITQIVLGVLIYIGIAFITKSETLHYFINMIKKHRKGV